MYSTITHISVKEHGKLHRDTQRHFIWDLQLFNLHAASAQQAHGAAPLPAPGSEPRRRGWRGAGRTGAATIAWVVALRQPDCYRLWRTHCGPQLFLRRRGLLVGRPVIICLVFMGNKSRTTLGITVLLVKTCATTTLQYG